jgi:hypothetical protein
LYDIRSDPDQLQNIYATADPSHIADLSAQLAELATSQGPPFLPGDFNLDGIVDTVDYVVWRKGLGTIYTQTDYDGWRANFGAGSADNGAGSGTTLPSAAPLSAAVSEPATPAVDGETTARDEAFSTLAPPRGFAHERRTRFAPFGRELSAQQRPLYDKDLLALSQGILRPGRDLLRGWLPPSMLVGEDGDRDTLERSFDEAFGTPVMLEYALAIREEL